MIRRYSLSVETISSFDSLLCMPVISYVGRGNIVVDLERWIGKRNSLFAGSATNELILL